MTNIRVALRVRPLSKREVDANYPVVVAIENNSAYITDIRVPERPSADSRQRFRQFDFDHTFWFSNHGLDQGGAASQTDVYREMGPHLEKAILAGYNACLLAYGQSGTGKTHSMLGSKDDPGIIPRLCHSLWDKLNASHPPLSNGKPSFRMEVSFLEIYREKVRDLLDPAKTLKLREHPQIGPHVQGLTRLEVTEEISLLDLLWEGERRRASGNTISNRRSSRSHAIWTLYLTVQNDSSSSPSSSSSHHPSNGNDFNVNDNGLMSRRGSVDTVGAAAPTRIITNQVHLVDLAGSEKADCTTAKSLLAEGADINRSLVALGNVISALAEKAQYVPYRDSALTWLLKDSIGGNASTSIIITASPSSHCHAQTLNSLRFAQRARLVENTPKIHLAPALSSSPGFYGPYGYLSVMSATELKKDISRLAKIIKTAQNNGGILRGLAPRASWTRLIHAIEGISHAEKEQVKLQRERACSEDRTAISAAAAASAATELGPGCSSSSSSSTLPTSKSSRSLNDVMVQADTEKRSIFRRRLSRQSESCLATATSSSTPTRSPTKIVGTEVFIPTSNSFKCLTWEQEEIHPVPEPISGSNISLTEEPEEDEDSSPKCSSSPQIQHMKYLLQVHYPTTHNLDNAARISEKIHGNITDDNYQQKTELIPVEVHDPIESNGPLVHGRIATLVNPSNLSRMDTISEQVNPVNSSELVNESVLRSQSKMIAQMAQESKEYLFPATSKSFASLTPLVITPFESSDENEFYDPEEVTLKSGAPRLVFPHTLQRTLSGVGDELTFDDTCYFTAGESVLSQVPEALLLPTSDSSSYESLNIPEIVRPVNLVREFSETDFREESCFEGLFPKNDLLKEDEDNCECEPAIANVCMVAGQLMESALPVEILVEEPITLSANYFNPVNGVSDSKFRNYFAKELHHLERMGKQIKSLLQMTQRYNVVKPYLDEISNLQNSDHSKADPKLDAHIESCSSWNVDVELAKVEHEIHSLNKVLKTGIGSGNTVTKQAGSGATVNSSNNNGCDSNVVNNFSKKYAHSSLNSQSVKGSTTSNEGGLTSDSSIDVDGFPNYAKMRHIPLLSNSSKGTSESSPGEYYHHPRQQHSNNPPNHFKRPVPPKLVMPTAKGSVSQPTLSSSSYNGSVASTSANNPSLSEFHFNPCHYSTPDKKKTWKCGELSDDCGGDHYDDSFHHPKSSPPAHPLGFKPHPAPPLSVNSTETFYRNPTPARFLQYCPSNSNLSSMSLSSNATSASVNNYDTNSSSYPESGMHSFPLNISHSETRRLPGGGTTSASGCGRSKSFNSNRGSESSSCFQPYPHNAFNSEEMRRSHKHLYEHQSAPTTASGGGSNRLSSRLKEISDGWMPINGTVVNNGKLHSTNNLQKVGGGDISDSYLRYFQQRSGGSDSSSAFCTCEACKYGSPRASHSDKFSTSSRSQFSSFPSSKGMEQQSDFDSRMTSHNIHPQNGLNFGNLNMPRTTVEHGLPRHTNNNHLYKLSRINRNENF